MCADLQLLDIPARGNQRKQETLLVASGWTHAILFPMEQPQTSRAQCLSWPAIDTESRDRAQLLNVPGDCGGRGMARLLEEGLWYRSEVLRRGRCNSRLNVSKLGKLEVNIMSR